MIKRKWAFVVAVIFSLFAIYKLFTGSVADPNMPAAYNTGGLLGTLFFPVLFFVIAFFPKKNK
ncbi:MULTISPECIES: hypothetical protein [Enterococcus]|uniref:Uncharacterized protein n=1 Tax=Enterococcus alishanensis TaxID=1303817 RepID=A0ABS6THH6_9ENTE|nr:hypothetical protein [Enterococcus alishanensis]MBV7392229.1 hypothetical protein [Enterococcus alishanensis]